MWNELIGWGGDAHVSPFHLASYVFIDGGFWLIAAAWHVLHTASPRGELATTGPYARVRHPQYDGFLLIVIGFLLQWTTIPTLVMFPILVLVYMRLAKSEEREVAARFGEQWRVYAAAPRRSYLASQERAKHPEMHSRNSERNRGDHSWTPPGRSPGSPQDRPWVRE